MNTLLKLEKNSKGEDKKTYIKIPMNHPEYMFPYNIEDRIEYLNKQIKLIFSETQTIEIVQKNNKLILNSAKISDDQHEKLKKLGGKYTNSKYVYSLE